MCGRYTINIGRARFETVYNTQAPLEFAERWNVSPTQAAPIIRSVGDSLEASMMRWGFERSSNHKGAPIINARAETVMDLPSFASSFRQRRCIVPATGWYEWRVIDGKKQPYYLTSEDNEPLAFAGIWTPAESAHRYVVITTRADASISHIHDRTPVILDKERWKIWLSDAPLAELEAMLEPTDAKGLDYYPVSPRVGNYRNDDSSLTKSVYDDEVI